jgi:hypothetical protein
MVIAGRIRWRDVNGPWQSTDRSGSVVPVSVSAAAILIYTAKRDPQPVRRACTKEYQSTPWFLCIAFRINPSVNAVAIATCLKFQVAAPQSSNTEIHDKIVPDQVPSTSVRSNVATGGILVQLVLVTSFSSTKKIVGNVAEWPTRRGVRWRQKRLQNSVLATIMHATCRWQMNPVWISC